MPSRKVTELETLVTPTGIDVLYVVDDPNGTPTSKKITIDQLFEQIPSNTSINGTFEVANTATFLGPTTFSANVTVEGKMSVGVLATNSNGIIITNQFTPANSSLSSVETGKIFFDANYLYIKVSNTVIKRAALTSF